MKLNIQCLTNLGGSPQVVGLQWYDGKQGYVEPDCPVLAIAYENGCMQIMRNENDDSKWFRIEVSIFKCIALVLVKCRRWYKM